MQKEYKPNWVETWTNCYQVICKSKKDYEFKLNELLEWNKPRNSRENDPLNKWGEWEGKVIALINILNEKF